MSWSVFDSVGQRKYLNRIEIKLVLERAAGHSTEVHAFCRLLAETGCRLTEALSTTCFRIDNAGPSIVFECLKKRRKGVFRRVPISPGLAALLQELGRNSPESRIWSWSRTTAWRHVSGLLAEARIIGPQACPKGFRHGFAVSAIGADAPLNLVQRWLGHANIETTSIYALAVGPEEREIVERMWARVRSANVSEVGNGTPLKPARKRRGSAQDLTQLGHNPFNETSQVYFS